MNHTSDEEYLTRIIGFLESYTFSYTFFLSDREGRCVSISKSLVEMLKVDEYIGKKVTEFNSEFSKYALVYKKIDNDLLNSTDSCLKLLLAHKLNDKIYFAKVFANKVINPTTKKVIGVLYFTNPVSAYSAVGIYLNSSENTLFKFNDIDHNENFLTEEEREIIFLLALGKSHKEIANILSSIHSKDIAEKTITSKINRNIYKKLAVDKIPALVEKAYLLRLLERLPVSFLHLIKNNSLIIL